MSSSKSTKDLGFGESRRVHAGVEDALKHSHELALLITEYSDDLISLVDMDGNIVFASGSAQRLLGHDANEQSGAAYLDLIHPDDVPGLLETLPRTLAGETVTFCNRVRDANGLWHWLEGWCRVIPYRGDPCVLSVSRDVTDRRRGEELRDGQRRLLEMIATDTALEETLSSLTNLVEAQSEGLSCSVLLLDKDDGTIRQLGAGSLPRELIEAIDGARLGPELCACGAAMHLRTTVIASDIASDPLWKDFRELAAIHELRACWSMPIFSPRGEVLGAFAMYCGEARNPAEQELELLELATRLASIAIERKQTVEALALSETSYRQLVEGAHDVIYTHDMAGRFLSLNRAAEELSGYTRDELLSMDLSRILLPQDFIVVNEGLMNSRESVALQLDIRTRDGRIRTVETRPQIVEQHGQKLVHGIARDITDRKIAEQVRLAHVHFLESMERVDEAIRRAADIDSMMEVVLDTVLSLFECDRAWLLYPCDPDAPSCSVVMERTRPEYPGALSIDHKIALTEELSALLRRAQESSEPIGVQYDPDETDPAEMRTQFAIRSQLLMAIHPARSSPWIFGLHQCSRPRLWSEQDKSLFKEIGRRVGDALRSFLLLKDLRAGEERYRSLVESLNEIVFTADRDGTLTYVSPSIERLSDYKAEQLQGSPFLDLVHPDDLDGVRARFKQTLAGIVEPFEFRVFDAHAQVHWIRVSSQPLVEKGVVTGIGGVVADITDRRLAEMEVRELNQDLERRVLERTVQLQATVEELEAFSYSVSHDLRVPLRTVDGFSHVLLDEFGDSLGPEGRDLIDRIVGGTRQMSNLIRDLLDLAKISRTGMKRESTDLSSIARTIAAELQRADPTRCVDFALMPGVIAQCDSGLLRTALQNLIGNAWKYSGKHPSARIEFGRTDTAGQAVYYVRDDGAGFDMSEAVKLFSAFQRFHSDSEFEGTGVGLATVQRIIHRHGGTIWAESAPERGATFYFTLDSVT
jgi:PAS domain S-box-containing protein